MEETKLGVPQVSVSGPSSLILITMVNDTAINVCDCHLKQFRVGLKRMP